MIQIEYSNEILQKKKKSEQQPDLLAWKHSDQEHP